ncbi:MAG: TetR family transcriptional regulator [Proteobacteria bacterium]|nr:TetR family transcriptional regulator [Pseudomonadota bacterium]
MKEKQASKRDIEKTKEKILKSAASEFAEHGLKGARVDAIANRAKVNKAMIYYIFGSKEDLHLAVLRHMIETKSRPVQDKISDKSIQSHEFPLIIDRYFDDLQALKEYARILLDDISTGAKALQRLKTKDPQLFKITNDVSALLKYFMDKGDIYPLDPDISVMAVVMLMVSFSCIQPYMHIVAPKGSEAHKNLSDPEKWKEFMLQLLARIFIADKK